MPVLLIITSLGCKKIGKNEFATTLFVVLFACFSAYATSIVDVRLSQQSYDKSQEALYVNIEVRVDNAEQLILAGQNYRIYYPSETLSLNQKGLR